MDNLVFLMNELFMHNQQINEMTPKKLWDDVQACARKR